MSEAAADGTNKRHSLREQAYAELKDLVLTGRLRPGERLSETRLAERLGVSRTPLREALMKLEEEGLVVGRRNLGYVVADFDIKTACDLLHVRAALDACAAELACAVATEEDLDAIRAIIDEMISFADKKRSNTANVAHNLDLGLKIHKVIAAATRNDALIRLTEQVYQQLQMALWLEVLFEDAERSGLEQHIAIADAIIARDPEAASKAARAHVMARLDSMTRVREIFQQRHIAPNLMSLR
ncbi:GntR family transcriptional regulator [Aquabacter sp. P-9]|uniref:GntR family transcriptional regulator n=1 Tax=Aquabacter sediminis TaxID=3029197 RepID=UPI00237DCD59|nr:GntR family transcriptional regulator [Aquabacter sp. P-9]MDE1568637.1 GntR family transcriptional regulator [Aquabacter sp. P-9]